MSRIFKAKCKDMAKSNPTVAASAFDFPKTLLAPAGNSSSFYYSRRLRLYHFTVSSISNLLDINCYLWNEDQAGKGSNEVASMLLDYLKDARAAGILEMYLFCHRCVGHNCNRMVFAMLYLALNWLGFTSITLSFLVTVKTKMTRCMQ